MSTHPSFILKHNLDYKLAARCFRICTIFVSFHIEYFIFVYNLQPTVSMTYLGIIIMTKHLG